jgi:protein-S-isoprenylcysteine O-methyltransferase Ste14
MALGTGDAPSTTALAVGSALVLVGTALMVAAQLDLGASWRVGIDERARPGLVTSGWYRICRNPIFLFMFFALGGIVIELGTWWAAAVFVAACVAVRLHVGFEEAYLEQTYGEAYRDYARHVGRFLPRLGRVP